MVAALTSSSLLLTTGSSRRCPWRSMLSISTGSEFFKPLAADAIGRLPQQRQRLAHRFVVKALTRSRRS